MLRIIYLFSVKHLGFKIQEAKETGKLYKVHVQYLFTCLAIHLTEGNSNLSLKYYLWADSMKCYLLKLFENALAYSSYFFKVVQS